MFNLSCGCKDPMSTPDNGRIRFLLQAFRYRHDVTRTIDCDAAINNRNGTVACRAS